MSTKCRLLALRSSSFVVLSRSSLQMRFLFQFPLVFSGTMFSLFCESSDAAEQCFLKPRLFHRWSEGAQQMLIGVRKGRIQFLSLQLPRSLPTSGRFFSWWCRKSHTLLILNAAHVFSAIFCASVQVIRFAYPPALVALIAACSGSSRCH